MEVANIVVAAIGFIILGVGLRETFYLIGHTDDPQFGQENTTKMFASLVMCVWGLSIVVTSIFIYLLIQ